MKAGDLKRQDKREKREREKKMKAAIKNLLGMQLDGVEGIGYRLGAYTYFCDGRAVARILTENLPAEVPSMDERGCNLLAQLVSELDWDFSAAATVERGDFARGLRACDAAVDKPTGKIKRRTNVDRNAFCVRLASTPEGIALTAADVYGNKGYYLVDAQGEFSATITMANDTLRSHLGRGRGELFVAPKTIRGHLGIGISLPEGIEVQIMPAMNT